jgi:hypothetical protein
VAELQTDAQAAYVFFCQSHIEGLLSDFARGQVNAEDLSGKTTCAHCRSSSFFVFDSAPYKQWSAQMPHSMHSSVNLTSQSAPDIFTWIRALDGLKALVYASEQASSHRKHPEQFSVATFIRYFAILAVSFRALRRVLQSATRSAYWRFSDPRAKKKCLEALPIPTYNKLVPE